MILTKLLDMEIELELSDDAAIFCVIAFLPVYIGV